MIEERLYRDYLTALLAGKRKQCRDMVNRLLDSNIELKVLYIDLFQRSMYEVGELWENNRITVANEHLATSITESLLNLAYPALFAADHREKKAVISCCANEFHQIGGKIIADVFELNGWDSHFLGANLPYEELSRFIQEVQPDVVGLSLSIIANLDKLKQGIEVVKADFPKLDLLIGGQAFRWGGIDVIRRYPGTEYISSLDELENLINGA